ncbi:lasso peptide isopeptide bond-forming cyclase [Streptomonospora sediminis]
MRLTSGSGAWFFLALPDNDAAGPIADRVMPSCEVAANHPSGRPWLIGCLPHAQVAVHGAGPNRLALIGSAEPDTGRLGRISDGLRSVGDATGISARFAGSFCVVGSLGGLVYAQGSAIGVHRVYHALIDGVRVVCDRADVLAELGGLPIDRTALALRLMRPPLPHPLAEVPLWSGLQPVGPGDYVTVDRGGRAYNLGTWWRRPEPRLSRAQGAERLRDALEAAVGARTASGRPVACDLSGGMDSTPLCYFAATGPTGVLARTMYNNDPGGRQDLDWARCALPSMPGVHEHVVGSTDDMPDFFGGLLDVHARFEEPSQAAMAAPRVLHGLRDSARRGVAIQLTGIGGDHLMSRLDPWEHALFRKRPLLAWRRAREAHAADGHRIGTTVRQLLEGGTYRTWLYRAVTTGLSTDSPDFPRISDWSPPTRLPPWLSADGRHVVAAKLREVAGAAAPLGADRGAHVELFMLREGARSARGLGQVGPAAGVVHDSPLLDDRVAEAVLAVRREERDSPAEWKPLMKAAMRGLLPEESLRRTTKVGGSPQAVRGFAAHHGELRALYDESGLTDRGLVDMDKLAETTRPDPKAAPPPHVFEAINTAMFLRNQVAAFGKARTDAERGR